MTKLEKIDKELSKAREKAAEWQAKIRHYRFGPTWPEV